MRRFSLELVCDGFIHNVASDAHDHSRRPPTIARELERAGLGRLANWLTQAVPAAILAGAEPPPRPQVQISPARGPRWFSGRN